MNFIKTMGRYKVWHYPRIGVYRISPVECPANILRKDFKSLQEIMDYITADEKTNRNIVYTDPYNVAIQWLKTANKNNDDYQTISCLVNQYYYGIQAKKELRQKLIEMNLIKD